MGPDCRRKTAACQTIFAAVTDEEAQANTPRRTLPSVWALLWSFDTPKGVLYKVLTAALSPWQLPSDLLVRAGEAFDGLEFRMKDQEGGRIGQEKTVNWRCYGTVQVASGCWERP